MFINIHIPRVVEHKTIIHKRIRAHLIRKVEESECRTGSKG